MKGETGTGTGRGESTYLFAVGVLATSAVSFCLCRGKALFSSLCSAYTVRYSTAVVMATKKKLNDKIYFAWLACLPFFVCGVCWGVGCFVFFSWRGRSTFDSKRMR